ncbi:hypothetical protein [Paenibacillus sonchi]|uniref:hypothetical protein n=1 Tax=Paenibacillus sonchi TaxID=373687 RepID=UPI001E539220|nr:hypothetical protein [Paenibacillus sonchi]MCE3203428.1 hypothetical protein [Paenibacillus sonchi]
MGMFGAVSASACPISIKAEKGRLKMENGTKFILNPDQKAVALKTLKDMLFAVKQLHDWISTDELTQEMAGILPSLMEDHFTDISKLLDYESTLTKEKEERHERIRQANARIRELEQQMGEQKPIDGLAEQLEYLARSVSDWWDGYGFHHVSEAHFTRSGILSVKFSFMLEYLSTYSQTPEKDKQNRKERIAELEEEGWTILHEESGRSPKLVNGRR